MAAHEAEAGDGRSAEARPVLTGRRVRLRPGGPRDAPTLRTILAEPSVSRGVGSRIR